MDEAKIVTELPINRVNTILKYVIELLWFEPQGVYVRDILHYLQDVITFNEYEQGVFPGIPFMPRYEVIVRMGTMPFEKAGWLEKTEQGRWLLTNEGRKACRQFKDSEKFFETSVEILQHWLVKEQRRKAVIGYDPFQEAQEHSWEQIKLYFEVLEFKDYKVVVASLLKAMGCWVVFNLAGADGENNVDMICTLDPLGVKKPRLMVHISKPGQVSNIEDISTFAQDLLPEDVGLYFSLAGFTSGVESQAAAMKNPNIRTIDLVSFVNMWVSNYGKIDPEGYSKFPIKNVPFLSMPDRMGQS
jgi:hypothetical protein